MPKEYIIWKPSKQGLGMGHVFYVSNALVGRE